MRYSPKKRRKKIKFPLQRFLNSRQKYAQNPKLRALSNGANNRS